jgi:putative transposase
MKRRRFSEEQIIAVLHEQEVGAKVADLCRKHGISDATFYIYGLFSRCKEKDWLV